MYNNSVKVLAKSNKENQPNDQSPEEEIKNLKDQLSSAMAVIDELRDLNKKYMKTIEWMEKTIKKHEDQLNKTKEKFAELNISTSSTGSPPLMKK